LADIRRCCINPGGKHGFTLAGLSDQFVEIDFSDFFYRQVHVIHAEKIKRKANGYANNR
jgi:hypothetical protein